MALSSEKSFSLRNFPVGNCAEPNNMCARKFTRLGFTKHADFRICRMPPHPIGMKWAKPQLYYIKLVGWQTQVVVAHTAALNVRNRRLVGAQIVFEISSPQTTHMRHAWRFALSPLWTARKFPYMPVRKFNDGTDVSCDRG